jgi:steroid delta-isomerase-like uncharacterized protein
MTRDEIRALIDRYRSAWERQDIGLLVDCYTEDCLILSPMFHTIEGRSHVESSFRELFKGLSDWTLPIDDLIVDHEPFDRAAALFTAHGTHRGEIFGVAGTGRPFEIRSAIFFEFSGGRIAREARLYDFTGLLVQLGILKAKMV